MKYYPLKLKKNTIIIYRKKRNNIVYLQIDDEDYLFIVFNYCLSNRITHVSSFFFLLLSLYWTYRHHRANRHILYNYENQLWAVFPFKIIVMSVQLRPKTRGQIAGLPNYCYKRERERERERPVRDEKQKDFSWYM